MAPTGSSALVDVERAALVNQLVGDYAHSPQTAEAGLDWLVTIRTTAEASGYAPVYPTDEQLDEAGYRVVARLFPHDYVAEEGSVAVAVEAWLGVTVRHEFDDDPSSEHYCEFKLSLIPQQAPELVSTN